MKKFLMLLMALTMTSALAVGAVACGGGGETSNSDSNSESTSEQPNEFSKPVITIGASTMDGLYASDIADIDWYADVTVVDEYDSELSASITDWDDLDLEAPQAGTYEIVYSATNSKGETGTAIRTVVIEEALPQIVLQVKKDQHANDKIDNNVLLPFEGQNYFVYNEAPAAALAAENCIIKNASTAEMTVSVNGKYGVVAIVNENGVVIEGRDGSNGKLVNEANPVRSSSTAKVDTAAFAENMVIPANGYAIVVQNGVWGENGDTDGRNWMNYNVIYQYGNVVQIYSTDTAVGVMTSYVNQAPTITVPGATAVDLGTSEEDAKAAALAGVAYVDDKGTFATDDDVTSGLTLNVTNTGSYSATTVGTYTFTIELADAEGNKTTVTRDVKVGNAFKMQVGTKTVTVDESQVLFVGKDDSCPSTIGANQFIIFTPEYTGTYTLANGYGAAMIVNKYGELTMIVDGANGGYVYTSTVFTERTKPTDATNYAVYAFSQRTAGDYVIIAPNGNGNIGRGFVLGLRQAVSATEGAPLIGEKLEIESQNKDITFETKTSTEA